MALFISELAATLGGLMRPELALAETLRANGHENKTPGLAG